jgi:hypothetical protein
MKIKLLYNTAFFLLYFAMTYTQSQSYQVNISNNATSLPVTGYPQLFYANFHPGIDFQYNKQINKSEKNRLYVVYHGGVIYHRFIQTLLTLSGNLMYERPVNNRLNLNIALGAGYGAAFNNESVAKLNESGEYFVRNRFVPKSQFVLRFQPGLTYSLKKDHPEGIRICAHFRTQLQGIFVKSYVPLLPVNSLLAGVILPISSSEKK